jgi:hypothetical protein
MSSRLSQSILVQFIITVWVELVLLEALEDLTVVELLKGLKERVAVEHPTFAPIPRWVPE